MIVSEVVVVVWCTDVHLQEFPTFFLRGEHNNCRKFV